MTLKFYQLLEPVLDKPALYVGKKSLRDLALFIMGLQYGIGGSLGSPVRVPVDYEGKHFSEFRNWVMEKYNYNGAFGWWSILIEAEKQAGSENPELTAVDRFKKELTEFRKG